jgi:hypothetical protein
MLRVVIVVAVVVVAFVVARLAQRRAPDAPTRTGQCPAQLDRADFSRPSAPWLLAVFTSATCEVCADTWKKVAPFESDEVAVQRIDFPAARALHDRYAVDSVPMVLVVDDGGVVRRSFVGPVSAADLHTAVTGVRGDG